MAQQTGFFLQNRNPDVLTSIANLSNDEVFTPPSFANQMLDTVEEAWAKNNNGASIWEDKNVTFLDPFTKSGVFLREITRRLSEGLEKEIPDAQERVNHILTTQVFGAAITQLTALLARRSVYCSKYANGDHSICTEFDTPEGNIWFERTEHTWVGGKEKVITVDDAGNEIEKTLDGACKYCGAKQKEYERGLDAESHAYSLIHSEDLKKWVIDTFGEDMHFDVIVGNPPYQLSDGGGKGTSAGPIYDRFVLQAIQLSPRFLSMVIPGRWFSGGKGLDSFRDQMLQDRRIRVICDFPDAGDVFPGVQIKGGVCYFLWNRDSEGDAVIATFDKGELISSAERPLLEQGADVLIRFNEAVAILRKVFARETGNDYFEYPKGWSFEDLVSVRNPFGLPSTLAATKTKKAETDVLIHSVAGPQYVESEKLSGREALLDSWKVFIPFLASGSDSFPHPILARPFLGVPGTACTESYLVVGPFSSREECEFAMAFIQTKLFRFLVLQRKPSQNATRRVYRFVPRLALDRVWTDEELAARYRLTSEELAFVDSLVRPVELEDA